MAAKTAKFQTYVLEYLTCEVLLSEEYLYETDAFEKYGDAFSYEDCDKDAVDVNTIMWVNTRRSIFLVFGMGADHRNPHLVSYISNTVLNPGPASKSRR